MKPCMRAGAGPCTLVVRDHGIYQRRSRRALSPPIAGERVGVEGGVEMGTYWRPTVPNPQASPKVRCAVSEI